MASRTKRNKLLRYTNYLTISPQSKAQSTNDKNSLGSNNIEVSTKTKVLTSSSKPAAKLAKKFVKFNEMFVDSPPYSSSTTLHSAFSQHYINGSNNDQRLNDGTSMNSDETGFLCHQSSRLAGGIHRRTGDKLILSPSQCKLQPAGLKCFDVKEQVNVINLQLNDVQMKTSVDGLMLPQQRRNVVESKTRATQTLFRESSAQTLPYLPGVSNDSKELETLEIFKLPTILPGDGPPGLYEVEVLERARKRWAFAKALKENFCKQIQAAREQAKLQDHEHILEAFEWEHWIEREENIQECQMLRLELLIRMFDKREREMHIGSETRIQKSIEEIEAKRKAALKKNEIEYNRAIRRLEIKHAKQPRVWRKQHITQELGDPSSEFYAPKMRYGVNPSRRHYTASRAGFDMRMDDLEKKAIEMDAENLRCPFAKLREWSKPKKIVQEVEQNFCSDANLSKLYESLRALRETSRKQKYIPLCLKAKDPEKANVTEEAKEMEPAEEKSIEALHSNISDDTINEQKPYKPVVYFDSEDMNENLSESFEELRKQKQAERFSMEINRKEMHFEELEALISSYEGNTIGWLMRFLSEEMCRLKEQRKLQFFAMMAKRQRWHREAAEAGLRQKENFMREEYEKLYEECDQINAEITDKFLNSILSTDIKDYAHQKAEQDVVTVAKDIDKEISGWLESFGEVQSPLNYHTLRHALKDIVVPYVEKILYRVERDDCIDYIINNVLLDKVYHDMEPYDVSFSLANNFVDRLLDNDLYLSSTDCSSDSETCSTAQNEAKTIIRKILRYAVPGRRWYSDEERIAAENIRDLLDDVFDKVITQSNIIDIDMPHPPHVSSQGAHTDLICVEKDMIIDDHLDESVECHDKIKFNIFNSEYIATTTDITKDLKWSENLLLDDPDKLSNDASFMYANKYVLSGPKPKLSKVRNIPSSHNISMISDFCTTPIYAQTSSEERLELMQLEAELEDEKSLSYEGFVEQLESVEESKKDETEEEKRAEFGVQEPTEFEEFEEFKESINYQTVQISDVESVQDYNTNSLMQVSFSYNPQVDFSVAMPSNGEADIEKPADQATVDSDDEKK